MVNKKEPIVSKSIVRKVPKIEKAMTGRVIPVSKGPDKSITLSTLARGADFSQIGIKRPTVTNNRDRISIVEKRKARGKDFSEVGLSGLQIYSGYVDEEFLPELRGQNGIKIYKEMRSNDATISAMLYVIEQLLQRTTRRVVIDDDSQEGQLKKHLIDTALDDIGNPWQQVFSEILTCLPFGFSLLEIILKQRNGENRDPDLDSKYNDGLIGWKGIELRSQDSLDSWEMTPAGRIVAMWQTPAPDYRPRRIPYSKALLFRPRAEKNNPEGISVLRGAYKSYWYKKRFEEIEGIAVERELTGLPVLTPPEGYNLWNPNDPDAAILLQRAEDIVRNIRMDQHMGIVLPFGWELDLKASSGSRSIDTTMIIGRLEQRMAVTLLADMLLIGQDRVGSFALVESKVRLFSASLQGIAKMVEDQFNRYAIPRLLRANGFDTDPMPKLQFGPVEQIDLKSYAEYVNKLVASQVIIPDDKFEDHVRQIAGFPEVDEESKRELPQFKNPPPEEGGPGFGASAEEEEKALPPHEELFPKKKPTFEGKK